MLIDEKALAHWIDHFYGCGSWDAKIWFVALEEAGGDLPEEVAEKLNYFYDAHGTPATRSVLCDVRALYKQVSFRGDGPRAELFTTLYDHRFGSGRVVQHGIWKNLIAFAHGYRGEALPDLLTYQKESFAVPGARREALIDLYPLPAHNHAWYYSWLDLPPALGYLKSRTLYRDHLYARRVGHILSRMQEHKPEVVLMYGMEDINTLKKQIQDFFGGVHFKMIKATKLQIPQHHLTNVGETTLLITTQIPALRHNRIETGFDWEVVGRNSKIQKFKDSKI
jgi:hypothetical protein